jgi:hypothetical protein
MVKSRPRSPVAGLRELVAGRGAIPYEVNFHIVAPQAASEADTVVVEAANRGGAFSQA